MMYYKIDITDEALHDMENIYNHIAIELMSPDNAMSQYNSIADAILTLDAFTERCKIVESEQEKTRGLRRLLVDSYSVFYVIEEERVIVSNVLYSATDIETRLNNK